MQDKGLTSHPAVESSFSPINLIPTFTPISMAMLGAAQSTIVSSRQMEPKSFTTLILKEGEQ